MHVFGCEMNSMVSEFKKKKFSDLVTEKSKDLFGYTPEQRTAENLVWMIENGYLSKKRNKSNKSRKPSHRNMI